MTIEELNYKLTGTENPRYITEEQKLVIDDCLIIINEIEQLHKHVVMESLRPTDDEIGAKVEEYGFRVPYDGSNKFYDDEAIKHFRAGAEWARGFGRNAP